MIQHALNLYKCLHPTDPIEGFLILQHALIEKMYCAPMETLLYPVDVGLVVGISKFGRRNTFMKSKILEKIFVVLKSVFLRDLL